MIALYVVLPDKFLWMESVNAIQVLMEMDIINGLMEFVEEDVQMVIFPILLLENVFNHLALIARNLIDLAIHPQDGTMVIV